MFGSFCHLLLLTWSEGSTRGEDASRRSGTPSIALSSLCSSRFVLEDESRSCNGERAPVWAAAHIKRSRTVTVLLGVALQLVPLLLVELSPPFISCQNLPLLSCKHIGNKVTKDLQLRRFMS